MGERPAPFEFDPGEKPRIIAAIQAHVREHLDRDIGVLQAEKLYDLMVRCVGARAYNRGVADAEAWMQGKLLDLEGDLLREPEA